MDFSRNWLFINNETQKEIKNKKIFMAGVGLGSQIAIAMTRIGFSDFILADGDTFSESNLNRQHCFIKDLGKNKALVTKKYIKSINPSSNVKVFKHFLKEKDLKKYVKESDYIINCIDFDSPEYLICHELCKKYNKKEIFVINLGFGTVASISNNFSPNFSSFFNEKDYSKMKNILINYFVTNGNKNPENLEFFQRYQSEKDEKPEPQIIAGTYLSSILTLKLILNDIEKKDIKFFPHIYSLDPLI